MAGRPGVVALLHYRRSDLRGDLVAGVALTAYLVPQVMAYATVAGLPAQTGLWVAIVAMAVYALIGTSRLLSVGPESSTALLTAAALAPLAAGDPARYASLAALLALIVGVYALLAWVLRLGFIGDLLSKPVLTGYMAGLAVIMVASQLGHITGVDVAGDSVLEILRSFASSAADGVNVTSIVIAVIVAGTTLLLTPRFRAIPVALIIVLATTAIVAVFDIAVPTVGEVASGPPDIGMPSLSLDDAVLLLLPALGIGIVGYADNLLTGRLMSRHTGERVAKNSEFLAMGATNLGSSLVSGFPVSSSVSRSVIAEATGARTQLFGLVAAGCTVVIALAFGGLLAAFPQAALGGLVLYAAVRLVDVDAFRRLWRFGWREFGIAIAALVGVLFLDILYGILAAVAISVIDLLTRTARPHAAVLGQPAGIPGWHDVDDYPDARRIPGLVVFRYDSPLFFANADDFLIRADAALDDASPRADWLLLNMEGNTEVDLTALDALESLRAECADRGVTLALVRVKKEILEALLRHGVGTRIGRDHIYPTLPVAVAAYEASRAEGSSGADQPG